MNIKIDIYIIISLLGMFYTRQIKEFSILYLFIFLHEIIHVFTALFLKIRVIEINFLPIGVNAKFDFQNKRKEEILVSVAGPIGSFIMAFIFPNYFYQNLFLGIMNLIPIYPLDGGRIIKNILILKYGLSKGLKKYYYIIVISIICVFIFNMITIFYFKKYNYIFVILYLFQIVQEELKKDKFKRKFCEIFNLEI